MSATKVAAGGVGIVIAIGVVWLVAGRDVSNVAPGSAAAEPQNPSIAAMWIEDGDTFVTMVKSAPYYTPWGVPESIKDSRTVSVVLYHEDAPPPRQPVLPPFSGFDEREYAGGPSPSPHGDKYGSMVPQVEWTVDPASWVQTAPAWDAMMTRSDQWVAIKRVPVGSLQQIHWRCQLLVIVTDAAGAERGWLTPPFMIDHP